MPPQLSSTYWRWPEKANREARSFGHVRLRHELKGCVHCLVMVLDAKIIDPEKETFLGCRKSVHLQRFPREVALR